MKHRTLDEIVSIAEVTPARMRLSRRERLERLATLIESHPRPVRLFAGLECLPPKERAMARRKDSPLWIASQDELLRQEGLGSDRVGEGMNFFELSWYDTHYLFCACHYDGVGGRAAVSKRVRQVAREKTWSELWHALRSIIMMRFPAALARRP